MQTSNDQPRETKVEPAYLLDERVDVGLRGIIAGLDTNLKKIAQTYLLLPSGHERSKHNKPVFHYPGVLAYLLLEHTGIGDIGIEVAVHLEIVHLLHHLRLDVPWSVRGHLQDRPSSIYPNKSLAKFGFQMQALRNYYFHELSEGFPADELLEVDQAISETWLRLSMQRFQELERDSNGEKDHRDQTLRLLSLLPATVATIMSPKSATQMDVLNRASEYLANVRLLSVSERVFANLNNDRRVRRDSNVVSSDLILFCINPLREFGLDSRFDFVNSQLREITSKEDTEQLARLIEKSGMVEVIRDLRLQQMDDFAVWGSEYLGGLHRKIVGLINCL